MPPRPPAPPLSLYPPPVCSRVGFYVSTFQSMAGFEEKFHKEIGRVRVLPFQLLYMIAMGTRGGLVMRFGSSEIKPGFMSVSIENKFYSS